MAECGADSEEEVALEDGDFDFPLESEDALGPDFVVDVEVEEVVLLLLVVVGAADELDLVAVEAVEDVVGGEGGLEGVHVDLLEVALGHLVDAVLQHGVLLDEHVDLVLQLHDLAVLVLELLLDAHLLAVRLHEVLPLHHLLALLTRDRHQLAHRLVLQQVALQEHLRAPRALDLPERAQDYVLLKALVRGLLLTPRVDAGQRYRVQQVVDYRDRSLLKRPLAFRALRLRNLPIEHPLLVQRLIRVVRARRRTKRRPVQRRCGWVLILYY